MITAEGIIGFLKKKKCNFFTGVPDSTLKELSFLLDKKYRKNHIIAVNEGSAISMAIGYFLSTKKIPCVYLQNSGLSNSINPLISIANKKVYSIPLILIIGWRGSPKSNDEPQHNVKGKITEDILKLLDIKYTVLKTEKDFKKFGNQIEYAKKNNSIVACLIQQGTIKKKSNYLIRSTYSLSKISFLKEILNLIDKDTKIISSTGYNSRELLKLRNIENFKRGKDFYMVGGMGYALSVALGFSLFSKKKTICLDGDGSLLMHLGTMLTAGKFGRKNLKYILLNNNSHDSVGGQETFAKSINFKKLSSSLGFKNFFLIKNKKKMSEIIRYFLNKDGPSFLEVKVSNTKNTYLPRPKDFIKIKKMFTK